LKSASEVGFDAPPAAAVQAGGTGGCVGVGSGELEDGRADVLAAADVGVGVGDSDVLGAALLDRVGAAVVVGAVVEAVVSGVDAGAGVDGGGENVPSPDTTPDEWASWATRITEPTDRAVITAAAAGSAHPERK
jgi:hypothetical protein